MEMKVSIQNFGKIEKAEIDIRELTVFAGINNTGKSYVSRALYSVLYSLREYPLRTYFYLIIGEFEREFRQDIQMLRRTRITRPSSRELRNSRTSTQERRDLYMTEREVSQIYNDMIDITSAARKEVMREIRKHASSPIELIDEGALFESLGKIIDTEILAHRDFITKEIDKKSKSTDNDERKKFYESYLNRIEKGFEALERGRAVELNEAIEQGYSYTIKENLINNFQVSSLEELIGPNADKEAAIKIEFASQDKISVSWGAENSNSIDVDYDIKSPSTLSDEVLYLHSPIYWELKEPLYDVIERTLRESYSRRRRLSGVRAYFYDSVSFLHSKWVQDDKEAKKIADELAASIKQEIGGEIVLGEDDRLRFVETQRAKKVKNTEGIDLLLTSTGVVQLGMLGLLISRGVLNSNTLLFIDEPEAHLHTEWQARMMAVLWRLKQYGVQVVIATHAPTIIQQLESGVDDSDAEGTVGLNFFNREGKIISTCQEEEDFDSVRRKINRDMNEAPFRILLGS